MRSPRLLLLQQYVSSRVGIPVSQCANIAKRVLSALPIRKQLGKLFVLVLLGPDLECLLLGLRLGTGS